MGSIKNKPDIESDWIPMKIYFFPYFGLGFFLFICINGIFNNLHTLIAMGYFLLSIPFIFLFILMIIADSKIRHGRIKRYWINFPSDLEEKQKHDLFLMNLDKNLLKFEREWNKWYEFFLNAYGSEKYHYRNIIQIREKIYFRVIGNSGLVHIILIKENQDIAIKIDEYIQNNYNIIKKNIANQ